MKLPKFTALKTLIMAGALTLAVAACGKPSVESSDQRYKANKDKMSALITKQPDSKAEFEKKLAEFETEYQAAMKAGTDEEKIKKLGELNSRMDKYIAQFDKPEDKKDAGGAEAPSGKLDGAAGTPPAGDAAPATGGKLGGAPAGGTAPAGSGGMGGGAPAGSGGMGGGAPAGGTAPAQPASGGMGGM